MGKLLLKGMLGGGVDDTVEKFEPNQAADKDRTHHKLITVLRQDDKGENIESVEEMDEEDQANQELELIDIIN